MKLVPPCAKDLAKPMTKELAASFASFAFASSVMNIKVVVSPERKFPVWICGSILSPHRNPNERVRHGRVVRWHLHLARDGEALDEDVHGVDDTIYDEHQIEHSK